MGSKANPSKYDCYANAEPDEPLFVLMGRDKHAPTLVWLWASLRELDGEKPDKVLEARECVVQMIAWLHGKNGQSVGLGQSALAGVLELIRMANAAISSTEANNAPTATEFVRKLLAETTFVPAPPSDAALEIAARVWCDQDMRTIVMDGHAAEQIARIIDGVLAKQKGTAGGA